MRYRQDQGKAMFRALQDLWDQFYILCDEIGVEIEDTPEMEELRGRLRFMGIRNIPSEEEKDG